jgi:hypothetical protein
MPRIRGKIIRILDPKTVIINLGRKDGIQDSSVFSILGEPETVVDPFSHEELGQVTVVKSRLGVSQVYDRMTIATTTWVETTLSKVITNLFGMETTRVNVDEGELRVKPEDIQPWKAKLESIVQLGDVVEVAISERKELKPEAGSPSDNQERPNTDAA